MTFFQVYCLQAQLSNPMICFNMQIHLCAYEMCTVLAGSLPCLQTPEGSCQLSLYGGKSVSIFEPLITTLYYRITVKL